MRSGWTLAPESISVDQVAGPVAEKWGSVVRPVRIGTEPQAAMHSSAVIVCWPQFLQPSGLVWLVTSVEVGASDALAAGMAAICWLARNATAVNTAKTRLRAETRMVPNMRLSARLFNPPRQRGPAGLCQMRKEMQASELGRRLPAAGTDGAGPAARVADGRGGQAPPRAAGRAGRGGTRRAGAVAVDRPVLVALGIRPDSRKRAVASDGPGFASQTIRVASARSAKVSARCDSRGAQGRWTRRRAAWAARISPP